MKRILVTGANKGIGFAIVRGILNQHSDTFVLLGSRDRDRGHAAKQMLIDENAAWGERVDIIPIDVASESSVREPVSFAQMPNGAVGIGVHEPFKMLNVLHGICWCPSLK